MTDTNDNLGSAELDFGFVAVEEPEGTDAKADDNNDNRPSIYMEGDNHIYRASALGSCIRALVLQGKDYSPAPYPAPILEAFKAGNLWEDKLVSFFRMPTNQYPLLSQWSIYGQQREYEIALGGNRIVRCHIDGIGRHFTGMGGDNKPTRTNPVVLEFKALAGSSISTFQSKGILAFPHYAWQVSIEMLSTNLPVLFVLLNKDKSDINDPATYAITTRLFKIPPYSRADILRRILAIEQSIQSDTLPVCEVEGFFCPYYQYHDSKESLVLSVAANIRAELDKYRKLDADIKLLEKAKKSLRDTVLSTLDKDGSYEIDDHYYILRNTIQGRRNVDIDALLSMAESKGIDVSDYISYSDDYQTYTVKQF